MEEKKAYTEQLFRSKGKKEYYELKSKAGLRIIEFDRKNEKDVLQKLREEFRELHKVNNNETNSDKKKIIDDM